MSILSKLLGKPSGRDIFKFQENVKAVKTFSVARHEPTPETAIIEIVNGDNKVLATDTIHVPCAPRGPYYHRDIPATFVVIGHSSLAHQEFEFPLEMEHHPFKLPKHLVEKKALGAITAKVWWSCEKWK